MPTRPCRSGYQSRVMGGNPPADTAALALRSPPHTVLPAQPGKAVPAVSCGGGCERCAVGITAGPVVRLPSQILQSSRAGALSAGDQQNPRVSAPFGRGRGVNHITVRKGRLADEFHWMSQEVGGIRFRASGGPVGRIVTTRGPRAYATVPRPCRYTRGFLRFDARARTTRMRGRHFRGTESLARSPRGRHEVVGGSPEEAGPHPSSSNPNQCERQRHSDWSLSRCEKGEGIGRWHHEGLARTTSCPRLRCRGARNSTLATPSRTTRYHNEVRVGCAF